MIAARKKNSVFNSPSRNVRAILLENREKNGYERKGEEMECEYWNDSWNCGGSVCNHGNVLK